ncbi:MAG: uracil-DNA glycosylase [Candidatus Sericytochromatia bacterium]
MTSLLAQVPAAWRPLLVTDTLMPVWERLDSFLVAEEREHTVFPPVDQRFCALDLIPPEAVKVVILGQDPYHNLGQAHGLAFSVAPGNPLPPSLRNIFKELQQDLDCRPPAEGSLLPWAEQGVLLLNTVLTVRAHSAASHAKKGWEAITDAVIAALSERHAHLVFVLWGKPAQAKQSLIHARHTVITSVHPSPLSAHRGFLGSRPFSQANAALLAHGQTPVTWCMS